MSFSEKGNKIYEGEFKNGDYHGKGVEYYANGTKQIEGVWIDGYLNGNGKEYYGDG